jgi:hypothetical protein
MGRKEGNFRIPGAAYAKDSICPLNRAFHEGIQWLATLSDSAQNISSLLSSRDQGYAC